VEGARQGKCRFHSTICPLRPFLVNASFANATNGANTASVVEDVLVDQHVLVAVGVNVSVGCVIFTDWRQHVRLNSPFLDNSLSRSTLA
jgi:hypothetical protein